MFLAPANIPTVGSTEWMRWFPNLKCGGRFDSNLPTSSTDSSLQLAASLQNFYDWRNDGSKLVAGRYKQNQKRDANPDLEYKVRRAAE